MHLRSRRVLESEQPASTSSYAGAYYPSTLGSRPSAGTQGSTTQDPNIAASDSSSDYDVMEEHPTLNPERQNEDVPIWAPQPGPSVFSRLIETFSRATRSERLVV